MRTVQHRHPDKGHGKAAHHIHDGVLLGEHCGRTDERGPHPGQHLQARALLGEGAAAERQRHAGGALAVDGRADVDRGVCAPQQLQDAHGNVAAPDCFCCGADVQAVGQHHVDDQTEGHARKHAQAELVVAGGVVPPQQRRDPRQQQKPAAIGEHEPLVERDAVIQRAVDDVFRVFDRKVQPEEPDEVDHPVQLEPQVRFAAAAQLGQIHSKSPIFYNEMTHYYSTFRPLAQTLPVL